MDFIIFLWKKIKPHYFWLAVSIGLVFVVTSVFLQTQAIGPKFVHSALLSVGNAVIASGVFAGLLKSLQFSGLFQEELKKSFDSLEFSKLLQDIYKFGPTDSNVFERIMERSIATNFNELQKDFVDSIARFTKADYAYYYKNYDRKITIKSYDSTTGMIALEDEFEFRIFSKANTVFDSTIKGVPIGENNLYSIQHYFFGKVGAQQTDMLKEIKSSKEKDSFSFDLPLKAGEEYKVRRRIIRNFLLASDPVFLQQFKRVCDGLTLSIINHAKDDIVADITFLNFNEDVSPQLTLISPAIEENRYTVDQLTFPHQGYIITLVPKRKAMND